MKTRPLLLSDTTRISIAKVIAHAEANQLSLLRMHQVAEGVATPAGDDPNYSCVVPVGYRCVYTIEDQPKLGWCRHLSVSVDDPDKRLTPNPVCVEALAHEFGFKGPVIKHGNAAIYTDTWDDGRIAVNVVQPKEIATAKTPTPTPG